MRLFYALSVPGELASELAAAQKALRGNWRPVRGDQMHVTLAYLPNIAPEGVPDLRDLGRAVVRDAAAFPVRLRGTGYFPNEGSPRVWFVKADAPELDGLAEKLRAGLLDLGAPFDDKPFKAHVTLARKKGPAPRVPPKVFDLAWTAARLELIKSVLHKSGPEYETVSHFDLQPISQPTPQPQEAPHG